VPGFGGGACALALFELHSSFLSTTPDVGVAHQLDF
jgi:hypothetical protein